MRYLHSLGGHPKADAVLAALHDDARLEAADAEADLAAHGGELAVVDPSVRNADRCFGAGAAAQVSTVFAGLRPASSWGAGA